MLGTHFPHPTAGRVITHGDAYRLSPVFATPQAWLPRTRVTSNVSELLLIQN
ncbi:hypothetical protein SAVERM_712 [Streptomyces avermitilis MA-4680 = NBRC 14893]|uniref:Uncharacterized protein n=1 Tax=Streptomyces avermitilis (strain ATCC 31267 / DSM 46492 / JCM 5070 / NBRC 14893 / NCIMB 12804 / NRRL 8165 / MA-4680) TaxID=227882 RepID=Q82Q09_STRAW|nr:hypothetical protein SAVERM_712 [Streptomyces avermitilis MA-4680 = NBRC 14893]